MGMEHGTRFCHCCRLLQLGLRCLPLSTRHSVPGAVNAFSRSHRRRPRRLEAGLCIVELLVPLFVKVPKGLFRRTVYGVDFSLKFLCVRMRKLG